MITYQLVIRLLEDSRIRIGKLGEFNFPAGLYIYTGSAKNNLHARVSRHLSRTKKIRWHIDYLLDSPHAEIINIKTSSLEECKLNQLTEGEILIENFGATDCKNGCRSHLKYLGNESHGVTYMVSCSCTTS